MRSIHLLPVLLGYGVDVIAGVKLVEQGKQFAPQTKALFSAKWKE